MTPNIKTLLLIMVIALPQPVRAIDVVVEADMPTTASMFYYAIGGGRAVPKPVSFSSTTTVNAHFRSGLGYSCGLFDPVQNVKQMFETLDKKIRKLPLQLTLGIEAAIAGIPAYLLAKANPALYNAVSKYLDDSFELFDFSYNSCKNIEKQVAANKGATFPKLMQASIADRWVIGAATAAEEGKTIDDIEEDVRKEAANEGVALVAGVRKGGLNQEPVNLNRDITVAGYNSLLGRSPLDDLTAPANVSVTLSSGSSIAIPLIEMWRSPAEAADWVTDVIGERKLQLAAGEGESSERTRAGRGLRPRLEDETFEIRQALERAVVDSDYGPIRGYKNTLQVNFILIDAIRAAQPFEQSIMLDRVAAEIAIMHIQNQTLTAKRLLYAGLKEANVGISNAAGTVSEQIREHALAELDAALFEVINDFNLKSKTLARTIPKILRHAEFQMTKNVAAPLATGVNPSPLVDGAVSTPVSE